MLNFPDTWMEAFLFRQACDCGSSLQLTFRGGLTGLSRIVALLTARLLSFI